MIEDEISGLEEIAAIDDDPPQFADAKPVWILCKGGCSGRGVQWMGVVLYSKLVHNVI